MNEMSLVQKIEKLCKILTLYVINDPQSLHCIFIYKTSISKFDETSSITTITEPCS